MQIVVTWTWIGMERNRQNLEIFRTYLPAKCWGGVSKGSSSVLRFSVDGGEYNWGRKQKRKNGV